MCLAKHVRLVCTFAQAVLWLVAVQQRRRRLEEYVKQWKPSEDSMRLFFFRSF